VKRVLHLHAATFIAQIALSDAPANIAKDTDFIGYCDPNSTDIHSRLIPSLRRILLKYLYFYQVDLRIQRSIHAAHVSSQPLVPSPPCHTEPRARET
jgi:hypothetical protein